MIKTIRIALITPLLVVPLNLHASNADINSTAMSEDKELNFSSASSATGELREKKKTKKPQFVFPAIDDFIAPFDRWNEKNREAYGLDIGGHYASMFQGISKSVDGKEKYGASGVFRLIGAWDVVGRGTPNKGTLVFTVDNRHGYRDTTPADLPSNAGYVGMTGTFFNDIGTALIYLNYQQRFNDGNSGLVIGRSDPNDYQGVLGYVNPWVTFTNLAILLDASVALPDSSWGLNIGTWIDDQWYVLGGINDANGYGSDNLEFFDGGAEFYTFAHLGWTPTRAERYSTNIHLMAWHVDEREKVGIEESKGIALGANWTFDKKWMPFVRAGFSDGSAPIYNRSVTAGLMYSFEEKSDQMGIAVNWGSPPNGLKDQTTVEAFWNIQLAKQFAITPDIQYIKNPSLNDEADHVWVYGLRTRITF